MYDIQSGSPVVLVPILWYNYVILSKLDNYHLARNLKNSRRKVTAARSFLGNVYRTLRTVLIARPLIPVDGINLM